MPTLDIGGQQVEVDDSFLKLTPEQQNATVNEIVGSLPKAAPTAQGTASLPSTSTDVLKSAGVGLGKGVIDLGGMAGDLRGLASGVTSIAGNALGASPETIDQIKNTASRAFPVMSRLPGSADIQRGIEGYTGEFYKPQTTAGKYAETIGSFVPAAAAGPGGIGRRMLAQALLPGAASEFAGQATHDTAPAAEPYARFAGAVAGSLAPGALGRVVNPLRPSAERQAASDVLRGEGVPVTAGQETGSPLLKALESPFGGNTEGQLEALTGAAMRRAGEPGGRASRQNVDAMFDRIGDQFNQIGARNAVVPDPQFGQDLQNAYAGYMRLVAPSQRVPAVQNTINDIIDRIQQNGGTIPGDIYNTLRAGIGRDARSMGADHNSQRALYELQNTLDDAMRRSMVAAGNHADVAALDEARRQYRNALPIERAATSGGEDVAQGLLTPGKLSQAVTSVHGRRNRARGQGDFAELADAADALLRPLPNSGTPVRAAAATIPAALGGGIGALIGLPAGAPVVGGMVGAGLGHALVSGAINNPVSRAYLTGRIPGQGVVANPTSTAPRDALAQALLRAQILQLQ